MYKRALRSARDRRCLVSASQLGFIGFEDTGERGSDHWHNVTLPAIRAAVNFVGVKEVAHACRATASMLCDALNERERKRWAGEWTDVLLTIAPDTHCEAILAAMFPDYSAKKKKRLTIEEQFTKYRESVERNSPLIAERADKDIGK